MPSLCMYKAPSSTLTLRIYQDPIMNLNRRFPQPEIVTLATCLKESLLNLSIIQY